jgi:hypothetical protein
MLRMHLEGLKRMVSIRGGLNSIRDTNPMVANSVFWAFAVALYEVPYPAFDPVLPPFFPSEHNLALPAAEPVISIFHDFGPAHSEPTPLNLVEVGVDPGIAVVVTSIQHVSQLIPTATAYSTTSTSLVILTRMCTLLSHLLSLSNFVIPPRCLIDDISCSALISESVRYATLLHVLTPWRGLPPDGTLTINQILHQLISTLKALPLSTPSRTDILLLWIFSVAGVSAAQMPERAWFVCHLVEMTEEMEISNWEEMKLHLRKVIWHEALCEKSHRKLWEEVLAKRKELSEGETVNI